MLQYWVSADHVHPDYQFRDAPVRVHRDRIDGTYSAIHARLGCGKAYATPERAIRGLFSDHACTVTKIRNARAVSFRVRRNAKAYSLANAYLHRVAEYGSFTAAYAYRR